MRISQRDAQQGNFKASGETNPESRAKQAQLAPRRDALRRITEKLRHAPRSSARELAEAIFFERIKIARRLRDSDSVRIQEAATRRDWRFFERLSKVFKAGARTPFKRFSFVEKFLQENWREHAERTDEEWLQMMQEGLARGNRHLGAVTVDSIKKARQRLGLRR